MDSDPDIGRREGGPRATPLGTEFTYQGRLMDGGGPANGLYDLRFKLFDALTLGNPIGSTICIDNVSVSEGLFTVQVDFGAQFAGQQRYLEFEVRADTGLSCFSPAGFTTLIPRQALSATPYALYARSVPVPLTLSGTSATQIFRADNASAFGGATAVNGRATAATGFTYGGFFDNSSTSGTGVLGRATAGNGTTYGLYGQSNSPAGTGVTGWASAPSGTTYGVHGLNASTSGRGVYGLANAVSGLTYGGYFESTSAGGTGVGGFATEAGGGPTYGVIGGSASAAGSGVYGTAGSGPGVNFGGQFESFSQLGRAVGAFARATSGVSFGGNFQNYSTDGTGVFGSANANSGTVYGVRGAAIMGAAGYGVFATGDLGASGTKSFRIDHPDDPANKYLLHYAAESPEVINFYSGKATLDSRGEAVIALPHYFAKINRDPRYSLTAIGAPMPLLHVAEEIDETALSAGTKAGPGELAPVCSFRIAGGMSGGKVCWRVDALRNDRWVQKRGAPVEIEKQNLEKGTYQVPEHYGQPPDKGLDSEATRQPLERPSLTTFSDALSCSAPAAAPRR